MLNPFKKQNVYLKFAQENIFTGDLYFLLEEVKKLVDQLLIEAVSRTHGKGFKGKRVVEAELAKRPSELAGKFKSMFYLLFFCEVAQVIGPSRNYKSQIEEQHLKYLANLIEQEPKMVAKLGADLSNFLNHYYSLILAPQLAQNAAFVDAQLARLAKGTKALGFQMERGNRGAIVITPNEPERKRLYDLWFASRKRRFSFGFKKTENEYSPYLKKLRKNKSIRYLANLICNEIPFANPTKIKILITFSVVISESVSAQVQKMITDENARHVRPKSFFTADLKKLSTQVEKKNGEYFSQLGIDLNSFLTAIRKGEDRQGRLDQAAQKAQDDRWTQLRKAVDALGFVYTLSPDNKVLKLSLG
ncbi:MAG: hypothetical protein A2508_09720 [Candidatus Lambdaproteobacteria bacterium RIFOXYD12_FULL_49_8]|uniref:Uncharacterized protein n=1 Tax=Candidatus Lambdaproteobacteria bacterium RIFOXYD2_FULL_50_16 TaxID=1817772 RepID=A0A1F6G622_9PROT|nr:MAG: hypothetical protein A2527_11680 [Candidatus Lambdaproteobacteria bacterium RIFOXYD2_FULL_50_16]OGG97600.1 MAG: hypothetical protein A2508_09720 [Candidatus Lambdaproteobacteria bacterium RIFOXYD12_FULL_49_8]